jgi:hypothetical protein
VVVVTTGKPSGEHGGNGGGDRDDDRGQGAHSSWRVVAKLTLTQWQGLRLQDELR